MVVGISVQYTLFTMDMVITDSRLLQSGKMMALTSLVHFGFSKQLDQVHGDQYVGIPCIHRHTHFSVRNIER